MEHGKSMRKRINVQFMLIAALAILATAVCSMLLFYHIFKRQVFDDLKSYSRILSQIDHLEEIEDEIISLGKDDLRVTLVDKDGTVTFDNDMDAADMENHRDRPEILEAEQMGEGTAVRVSETNSVHTLYYAVRLADGRILRLGKESDSIYQIFRGTVFLVIVLSVIILGICSLLSYVLIRRLLSPIERMAANLDGINQDISYREMDPFIATIREQHVNILNHARMRQEFTANVSHELKTPLTAISGYAELIGSGMADEKDTRRFAGEIQRSSERLLTLINDIIKLSELDEGGPEFETEQVNLYQAAEGCVEMLHLQAAKQEVSLTLSGEPCMITANKTLIDELLYNLCSNAIRYNNRGGSVVISMHPQGNRVLLSVKDTGIGISREHQERIFERFYRVDKSRSKQSGGTGLGLAIVKHIVAQHNAEMTLISEKGRGTEIQILF